MSRKEPSRIESQSDNLTLGQRSRTRHSTAGDHFYDSSALRTRSMAAASVSTRSADLSQRVNRVEEGIYDIRDQLKELISVKNSNTASSTPRQSHNPLPRPPQRYLDFERELRRAEPPFDTQKGKENVRDFFVANPIPRPYMFLQGQGLHAIKDKLAHRDKMTFNEYVQAFTTMLMDKRVCDPAEWPQLVNHLAQVACDARTRSWEHVRAWSDHVFTRIENGDITWSDCAEIQFDRMRLSLAPAGEPAPKSPAENQNQKQVVCSDFNARRCKHLDNHVEAGFTFLHVCAWCHAALGNRNPHTVVRCENKLRFTQDRPTSHQQPQAPPRHQQFNQHQQFQQPTTYQSNQQQPRRQVFTSAVISNPQPTHKPKNDQ